MFHLTAADLRQAGGRVRCGECAHVFHGMDFLEGDPDEGTVQGAVAEQPTDLQDIADTEDLKNYPPLPELEDDIKPDASEILFVSDDDAIEETEARDDDSIEDIILVTFNEDELDERAAADTDESDEPEEASQEDDDYADEDELDEDEPDERAAEDTDESDKPEEASQEDDDYADEDELDEDEPDERAKADTDESDEPEEDDDDDYADEDNYEIDDTIWDNIPGVGSIGDDAPNLDQPGSHADDTGAFLNDSDADVPLDDATDTASAPPDSATADSVVTDLEDEADEADEAIALADSTLEFNVPGEKWPPIFATDTIGESKADEITPLIQESVETETVEAQADESPPWQFYKYSTINLSRHNHHTGRWLFGAFVLALAFATQLIHYNRDSLAAHPEYGANIRSLYATLGQPVYPDWSIKNYEIRGSEAVVGETGADVMDIRTQIAVIGDDPVGLPLLQVTLNDRWSNPVAARHFNPEEYATEALPSDNLLLPNSSITAHLSIIDPGSGAQGYELELCIPQRNNQLQCSGNAFK
jgi:predicted Zn finger-like uncharacterized protein